MKTDIDVYIYKKKKYVFKAHKNPFKLLEGPETRKRGESAASQ